MIRPRAHSLGTPVKGALLIVETSNTSQRGSAAAPDGLWVIYSTPNWAARGSAGLLAVLVLAAAARRMRARRRA